MIRGLLRDHLTAAVLVPKKNSHIRPSLKSRALVPASQASKRTCITSSSSISSRITTTTCSTIPWRPNSCRAGYRQYWRSTDISQAIITCSEEREHIQTIKQALSSIISMGHQVGAGEMRILFTFHWKKMCLTTIHINLKLSKITMPVPPSASSLNIKITESTTTTHSQLRESLNLKPTMHSFTK